MPVTTPLSYCDQRFIRPHLRRSAAKESIHTVMIRITVIVITEFSNLRGIQNIPGAKAPNADSGIWTPARELPAYWFSRPAPSSSWVSLHNGKGETWTPRVRKHLIYSQARFQLRYTFPHGVSPVSTLFIVLLRHVAEFSAKPPGAFESPLITALRRRWCMEVHANSKNQQA